MKRFILIAAAILAFVSAAAQSAKNNNADSVIGRYESVYGKDVYRVKITKNTDGTYKAQVYWLKYPNDEKTGEPLLDTKNPNKNLRSLPRTRTVLIQNLKYLPEKKAWGDAKLYDPEHGLKANVSARFLEDGRLSLKGTILGIGQTIYWTPIK